MGMLHDLFHWFSRIEAQRRRVHDRHRQKGMIASGTSPTITGDGSAGTNSLTPTLITSKLSEDYVIQPGRSARAP
jgi:hypothetical protein